MTNELTDVRCPCGDEFPADSYDAGFIAGSGMCQNCDAAMPPKDIPAPVEQAGGDDRDLQGTQGERDGWGPLPIVQVPWNVFDRAVMWVEDRRRYGDDGTIVDDWKALKTIQRAALAQPSPKCTTCGGAGMVDDGEITCSEGGIPYENGPVKCVKDCPDCAQPSPAPELERPEVAEVAFVLRNIGAMDAEDIDGDNVDLRFEDAEGRDTGCDVSIVEYAEKAADLFEQHDRIVGGLNKALEECIAVCNATNIRLHEVAVACATAEQERDATLARVEQQERTIAGMNEAHAKLASLYEAAQAQHSVPEGFREKFKQCMELAFAEIAYYVSPEKARDPNSRARKAGALATELLAMLAAAPGKGEA